MRDTDGKFTKLKHGDHIRVPNTSIAMWYIRGCEDDSNCAIVKMVGDDRYLHVDVDDIRPVDRDDFCGNCGQIGCGHG